MTTASCDPTHEPSSPVLPIDFVELVLVGFITSPVFRVSHPCHVPGPAPPRPPTFPAASVEAAHCRIRPRQSTSRVSPNLFFFPSALATPIGSVGCQPAQVHL